MYSRVQFASAETWIMSFQSSNENEFIFLLKWIPIDSVPSLFRSRKEMIYVLIAFIYISITQTQIPLQKEPGSSYFTMQIQALGNQGQSWARGETAFQISFHHIVLAWLYGELFIKYTISIHIQCHYTPT